MDLRGTPHQVFARMPDTIRESARRAYEKGHQYFEVPCYEDCVLDGPPPPLLKSEDALKLRYYRFTLRDIFDAEGLAALAMVDPVLGLQYLGRSKVNPKALFNRLPFEEQFKARRGYDEGATGYTTDIPGVGRIDFNLRQIFSFPPGKPPSRFEEAVREDLEKTVADGVDAMHLEKLQRNWPYDVPGTWLDAPVPEAPNNTPRGLLMVAPMDYRLGQWRAC